MSEPLWFDPRSVVFKIAPHVGLGPVADGDWDIDRRFPLSANLKHLSIYQRYAEGRRWEDTHLFRDIYPRRFAGRGRVRGAATIGALLAQYYDRVDRMFLDMGKHGFRTESEKGKKYPLPSLLIGRGGEIFLGNQGNHRFAMAGVLGLDRIAGDVICKHLQAA